MRVRTFKPKFAPLVQAGTKRQTIRPIPKRPRDMPKVGDKESWREWTGRPYHSKQRELVQVEIVNVERFKLTETTHEILASLPDRPLNGGLLAINDWNNFAKADGFKSFLEMVCWFEKQHGLPFEGILIQSK